MTGRVVPVAVVLLALLTAGLVIERAVTPSDGAVVQLSNGWWHNDKIKINFVPGYDSGLRPGDTVTGVDASASVYRIDRDGAAIEVPVRHGAFPLGAFLRDNLVTALTLLVLFGIALYVFAHRPRDRAAQTLLLVAALTVCGTTAWLLGADAARLAATGPTAVQALGEVALAMVWGVLLHFALILPGSGLRPSRRAVAGTYALPLVMHAVCLCVLLPAASGRAEAWGRIAQVSLVPSTVLPPVAAVLTLLAYRSMPDGPARRRTRWVLIPFYGAVAGFLGFWTVPTVLGLPVPPTSLMPLLFLPSALGIAAAVLRFGWFDVELILRRSLLYGALTAGVLGLFLGATWIAGRITGPRPGSGLLIAAGLVALSAQPLRRWLQRRIGRLIYGERHDPYEVIARLDSVDAAARPGRVLQDLTDTLARTLRLRYVEIDLVTARAATGRSRGGATVRELAYGAERPGRLVLEVGPGHEPFGAADEQLLDAVIRQISRTASAMLLGARLQAAREDLVLARGEEHRRLHHRLHDGLGPSLAAIAMQLELAKAQAGRAPEAATGTLRAVTAGLAELGDEVRRLIYDLRPPVLDQLGLAAAIRERVKALPDVEVHGTGDLGGLPAAAEVAAFWIAVEAAHNAARHAPGARCRVRLARDADLTVEVVDEGPGLPAGLRPGGGFSSMRDRAEELGGRWSITGGPGRGTRVLAVLPCPGAQLPSTRAGPARR